MAENDETSNMLTVRLCIKIKRVKLCNCLFGLGATIKVNAIIGLPISKEWKVVLDKDEQRVSSKAIGIYFDLLFQHAVTGFPDGDLFGRSTFV